MVLATTRVLDARAPTPRRGVLDTARSTGRDAVTRQPGVGVRIATTCYNGATYLVDAVGAALRTTQ